jgi:sulfotransferase
MLFFNSSMPRSGSELLQVILHQNPSIYASATSPLLEYQFGARVNFDLPEVKSQDQNLMLSAFTSMCGGMAQAYYEPITRRPNVCDKNRGWIHYYEWVSQWNPDPKMICMVRDLRNVYASMERIFRNNRNSPQGIDNPANLENMTTADRIEHWSRTQPIGLALLRTADSFQRGINDKVLFVRYEDLCDSPRDTLDQIYQYLGLDRFEHSFDNLVKGVSENDSHYGIFGQHKVSQLLQPSKKDAWRDVYTKNLTDVITQNHQWFFNTFNYEI